MKNTFCLAAGLLLSSAWAATPLHEALELAWARAQAATDLAGAQHSARTQRDAAQRWWAGPASLNYTEQRARQGHSAPAREQELAVSLPLWWPGQRAATAAAAQGRQALLEAQRGTARLQLAGALREAAWAVAARQAEHEQAQAQRQSLRQLAADVERRVAAGDLARTDAQAAEAELLAVEVELGQHELALQQALGDWQELLGPDGPAPEATAEALADGAQPHPALHHAERQLAAAQQLAEWARASRREPVEVSLGLRQTEPGQRQTQLSLRLPLEGSPERHQQEAEARAAVASAERQLGLLREHLALQQRNAQAALRHAEQRAQTSAQRAVLLNERAGLIERAFQAGEAALPELLRARAAAAAASAEARQHQLRTGWAGARLNQAFGVLP